MNIPPSTPGYHLPLQVRQADMHPGGGGVPRLPDRQAAVPAAQLLGVQLLLARQHLALAGDAVPPVPPRRERAEVEHRRRRGHLDQLAEDVLALGHHQRPPLLLHRRRLLERLREPVVVSLLREPRTAVVLPQVPHGGLQAGDLLLERVHLARRRDSHLLACLGAGCGLAERARVARDLLPLVPVRLKRLELAILLLDVLLEGRSISLGLLDLQFQIGDEVGLGGGVAHAGLKRVDLEHCRAEVLLALRDGSPSLIILLLEVAKLLLGVDRDGLDGLEILRAENPWRGATLKLLGLGEVGSKLG
ncbi:hypothetical protein VP1G_10747 [Cytospora mali]|uniref:Uncharacterized protein n=1 Tax=Cytospora mali TaxID=578113 RepID=A0A194UUK5_CYTMA|nr:hypothetical protein VP1G_10747 [Valsa mali var. pyri (nom. inval.)]